MSNKRVLILGAGISGLSLAWYLRKYMPQTTITILEKNESAGGVIRSFGKEGLVFDLGPKTFRTKSSKELMSLIEDTCVEKEIIYSSNKSNKKYLYTKEKLQKVPTSPVGLLSSSIGRKLLLPLLKESKVKKGSQEDETIGAFFRRRFGNYITDTLVEPFVVGVCAGDMHKLSINSYFPEMKKLESSYGSIVKGMFKRKKEKSKKVEGALFNLKGGLHTLIDRLEKEFSSSIIHGAEVTKIEECEKILKVHTNTHTYEADHVFSALPLQVVKKIHTPFDREKDRFFHEFPSSSIACVNFAFKQKVLPKEGFGYLVPSVEKEKILGVVFDSEIFPYLDESSYATKLTVMLGGSQHPEMLDYSDETLINIALDALYLHLGMHENPDVKLVTRYDKILPQYPLYHNNRRENLFKHLKECHPKISLIGNYLKGASVNACIKNSYETAKEFVSH